MAIRTWNGKVTPPAEAYSASDMTVTLHYLDVSWPSSGEIPDFFLGGMLDRSRPEENGDFTLTFDDSEIPADEPPTVDPPLLALVILLPTAAATLPMWILGPYELSGNPLGDPNGDPLE